MKFNYIIKDSLPVLAWCAEIVKEKNIVNVYCGNRVEIQDGFFVEGAWDGEFEEGEFDKASFLCGSGGEITNINNEDKVIFSTPGHPQEYIKVIENNDSLFISNSMPFVLSLSNCDLSVEYIEYDNLFYSIIDGIDNSPIRVPLANSKVMYLYYYSNLLIEEDLSIKEIPKCQIDEVKDYSDYYSGMINVTESIKKNANDSRRKQRYGLVSTISKGYDAPACAAIAKKVGCDSVVSFDKPKKYSKDFGGRIAEQLGYSHVIKGDGNAFLRNEVFTEAESIASGDLGTTAVFHCFEESFKNNLVFFGVRGDRVWPKYADDVNSKFKFTEALHADISNIEWRLRVGYIFVPLPLYRAIAWPSIYRLSNSDEMKEYSVGGKYDRPIPRRIIEESGVDRNEFGFGKMGAGINYQFDNMKRIKSRMSEKSFASFEEFVRDKKVGRSLKQWFLYFKDSMPYYLNYGFAKIGIKIRFETKFRRNPNPGAPSYLIPWAAKTVIEKSYQIKQ